MRQLFSLSLIVITGAFYQICSKQMPQGINPFAPLVVVYMTALMTAVFLYHINGGKAILLEIKGLRLTPIILGIVICFYELGFILAYRSGFKASQLSAITTVLLMFVMTFLGYFLFKENISVFHLIGLCIAGLGVFITTL